MARPVTTPVQVRLPEPVNAFLTELAHERHESKTDIVVEALECLRQHLLEQKMEEGYREIGDSQLEYVEAALKLASEVLPD